MKCFRILYLLAKVVSMSSEVLYNGNTYLYQGIWYYIGFPVEWATSHLPETGPDQCDNCAHFGMYNGNFIGYCSNCAHYIYNGTRGRGFIDIGVESNVEDVCSAFDTYLKDLDINTGALIKKSDGDSYSDGDGDSNGDGDSDGDSSLDFHEDFQVNYCDYEGGYNDF